MYKEFAAVFFSVLFAAAMIVFPETSMGAVKDVIKLWGLTVVPSLLPFFICSNFMLGIGLTDRIAAAGEKTIRRVFNTSGNCAFAFIMSVVSGYPVGIKILSDLRCSGRITKKEGEIGMSFCSTSGPLFMIGAVGSGLLGSSVAGWVIAISHYLGAVINGVIYGKLLGNSSADKKLILNGHTESTNDRNVIAGSVPEVSSENEKNRRRFSQYGNMNYNEILGKSILDGVNTLFLICGYMVIFMIALYFIKLFGATDMVWIPGFLELSVGCREVSNALYYSFIQKCIICGSMVSFGGLCVIFQSLSFLGKTDLSLKLFVLSKITHGIISSIIIFMLCHLLNKSFPEALCVFSYSPNSNIDYVDKFGFIYDLLFSGGMVCGLTIVFFVIVIGYDICGRIKKKPRKDL